MVGGEALDHQCVPAVDRRRRLEADVQVWIVAPGASSSPGLLRPSPRTATLVPSGSRSARLSVPMNVVALAPPNRRTSKVRSTRAWPDSS